MSAGITSRAAAEARGWTFEHEAAEATRVLSSTQGRTQTLPATIVASKYVNLPNRPKLLVHEQGETEDQILARIDAYEYHLASVAPQED